MDILPNRYNTENLKGAVKNPAKFAEELERVAVGTGNLFVQQLILKNLFRHKYGSGIRVMDQDWDNLIILDACRFPEFKQVCEIDGELEPVVSKGSTSREWIRKNFIGKEFHDTVYVGGNPHMEKFENEFHYVKKSYSKTGINEDHNMAEGSIPGWHPDAVFENAVEAINQFPNKRLIIHFMQPHDPYIGPKAEKLRKKIEERENVTFKKRTELAGEKVDSENTIGCLRAAADKEYISEDQLFDAYIENLEIVLDYVGDLLLELSGKSVISADHGELLGAGKFTKNTYGHPIGVYQSELRIVPWLEIEGSERREVYAESPLGVEEAKDRTVEKNLEALGYK